MLWFILFALVVAIVDGNIQYMEEKRNSTSR